MKNNPVFDKMKSVIGEGPDRKSYLGQDDFVEVRHRNIRLAYHVKNQMIDLARLLGTIRRIMEKVSATLNLTCRLVEIEIFKDKEEWAERHTHIEEQNLPSWISGDSGRVIRLVMKEDGVSTFEDLQLMVTHECVHFALRTAVGENPIPAWLDEGVATYFSQKLPAHYEDILKKAIAADACIPLEVLSDPLTRFEREVTPLAYAQSYALVEHLVQKYGWEMIRDLVAGCGRGDTAEGALKARGLTSYLLEKEWTQAYRQAAYE